MASKGVIERDTEERRRRALFYHVFTYVFFFILLNRIGLARLWRWWCVKICFHRSSYKLRKFKDTRRVNKIATFGKYNWCYHLKRVKILKSTYNFYCGLFAPLKDQKGLMCKYEAYKTLSMCKASGFCQAQFGKIQVL